MSWPSDPAVFAYLLRGTLALVVVLIVGTLRPRVKVITMLWAVAFSMPLLLFLPLPGVALPILPAPDLERVARPLVYETRSDFAPFESTRVTDPGPGPIALAVALAALAGFALLVLRSVSTGQLVRQSEQASDEELLTLVCELSLQAGLADVPVIKYSDRVGSPCTSGVLQPVILLPASVRALKTDEIRPMIAHELAHIRRRDPVKLFSYSCIAHLFWWNPVVRVALREALFAMELAVDQELALGDGYVRLLTSLAPLRPLKAGRFQLGLLGREHLLSRIRRLESPTRSTGSWPGLLGALGLVVVAVPWNLETPYSPEPHQLGANEIVFLSDRTGVMRLWRASSNGRSPKMMADTFIRVSCAAVSPDGRWIAYGKTVRGSEDIFVARADGTEEHLAFGSPARESGPAWSPDGKKLAFATMQSGNWELGIVNIESGKVNMVTNDGLRNLEPSWHPSGRRIVFASHRSGKQQLWSIGLDGSALIQITRDGNEDTHPRYSRDGRHVLFSSPRRAKYDVFLYDLLEHTYRLLTPIQLPDAGEPEFVDGGTAVVMSVNTGTRHTLARNDLLTGSFRPLFSPGSYESQVAAR